MQQTRFLRPLALAVVLAAGVASAAAQTGTMPQPNPDADRLAQEMRVIAVSPENVPALLRAGELSARLGDSSAAFAFFARAQSVDPANPRILAGRAMALARLGRPGEALGLFQTAEARGVQMREYAADRGFAYDLIGQPLLAQRDYKLALQTSRDDELLRRYALSLGITGNADEAMRQLDPLLRRQDRAAWRTRAFVLAMNGDLAGAERIASSMMPGNMGPALAPFFRRLASMAPADRAFAAHFGELSPTPARVADARMAPQLTPYTPRQPVQVAQAQPSARGAASRRARATSSTPAPAARQPVVRTAAASLPPPRRTVQAPPKPVVQPLPTTSTPAAAATTTVAAGGPIVTRAPAESSSQPVAAELPAAGPARTAPVTRASADLLPNSAPLTAATQPSAAAPSPQPAAPPAARAGEEDVVLASIIANLTIPAEELQVVSATPVELPPSAAPVRVAAAAPAVATPKPKPEAPRAVPAKEEKKPAPAKPAPKKPEPKAKPDPSRIWVQVASGANEGALPKAWSAAVAKAPVLKGKSGWSTAAGATNRVLTGPFKTSAEAQAFVNTLARTGVSSFVVTSEAGQKVTKLGAK